MKLIICTPGASMVDLYVQSLVETMYTLQTDGHDINYATASGADLVNNRNKLSGGDRDQPPLQTPYGGDYDYMLWIDSDQAWKPWMVYKLMGHDKPIVSAAIRTTDLDYPVFASDDDLIAGRRVKELPEQLTQVAAVGFGFVLLQKGVLETMQFPYFRNLPALDGKLGTDGEDVSFCRMAREAGHTIWLDPTVRVAHLKTIAI